jgi:Flp pilus assembly protein TadD
MVQGALLEKHGKKFKDSQDQNFKALLETVESLIKQERQSKTPELSAAVDQLKMGNTELAKQYLLDRATSKKSEGMNSVKEAAESFRQLGALAFLNNNEEAIKYYREATKLDPENFEGYNQLANVLLRKGESEEAEAVLLKLLDLAKKENNVKMQAMIANNMGILYSRNKNAEGAKEMFLRAEGLNKSIKRKRESP